MTSLAGGLADLVFVNKRRRAGTSCQGVIIHHKTRSCIWIDSFGSQAGFRAQVYSSRLDSRAGVIKLYSRQADLRAQVQNLEAGVTCRGVYNCGTAGFRAPEFTLCEAGLTRLHSITTPSTGTFVASAWPPVQPDAAVADDAASTNAGSAALSRPFTPEPLLSPLPSNPSVRRRL